jgi:hypothetical protein
MQPNTAAEFAALLTGISDECRAIATLLRDSKMAEHFANPQVREVWPTWQQAFGHLYQQLGTIRLWLAHVTSTNGVLDDMLVQTAHHKENSRATQ